MTGSRGTVLVVEDEAESLRLMIGILEAEGYEVRPADSGELALAAVAAEAPELILLDIRMAGIDGFDVCQRIKASEECREIPLMFISAATEVEDRVKGLALGAVDFVSKPFQREELLARVRTHLELGRLRTQLEKQVAQQTAELRASVKQLELEVAERQCVEQHLMLAQSAARVGIWDWDLLTNAHTVSGEYLRLYGLPPDHPPLTYEGWLRAVHPDDRERVQALVREATERTRVWDAEFRVLWPDGSVHWLLGKGTVFLDDCRQPARIAGVNLDITDRKLGEAALRASELQYKEVFDNISVCMFLLDVTSDGRFKLAGFNAAEEKAIGLSNAEVSGKFVEDVFAEDLAKKLTANYRRCLEAGAPMEYDDELSLPAGSRYFHSNLIPIRNAAGRIHRIVGACIDVTDRKRAEGAVRQSLDEIAHLNRVAGMGELTASLAHELNQPLAAILSNAQAASRFLDCESPDFAQVRECLTDIVSDDRRAGEVIQRLRALLKKGEFQASLVDLNEVVGDVIRLVGHDALLRNAIIRFEPLPSLPPVLGDRIQLYQVVLNLIVNGLEAASEPAPRDRWLLARTAQSNSGAVELTVEDSGKGIAESDLSRVFEPFFTTKQKGLGMGLSISRSIVQAHGGRIWAENSGRGGAVFRCILPVAQQAAAAGRHSDFDQ